MRIFVRFLGLLASAFRRVLRVGRSGRSHRPIDGRDVEAGAPVVGVWEASPPAAFSALDLIRQYEMERDIERHRARSSESNSDPAP